MAASQAAAILRIERVNQVDLGGNGKVPCERGALLFLWLLTIYVRRTVRMCATECHVDELGVWTGKP